MSSQGVGAEEKRYSTSLSSILKTAIGSVKGAAMILREQES